jgi:CheY-like chemotaxis protein
VALDVLLPRMDGWDVLSRIKGNPETREIPVLLVSVLDQQAFGKKMGADEYLLKPVEPKFLRQALRRLVGHKRQTSDKNA